MRFVVQLHLKFAGRHQTISFPPETPSLHVTIWEDRSIVPQPQQTAKPLFFTGNSFTGKSWVASQMITSLFSLKNNKSPNHFEHPTGNLQNGELVHLPWVKWMRFEMYQDSNLYCIGERIFSSSLGCSHGKLINMLQIDWRPNQNVDHQILSYNSLGHNFGLNMCS